MSVFRKVLACVLLIILVGPSYGLAAYALPDEIGSQSVMSAQIRGFTKFSTTTALSTAREDYLIVALDPGHGGSDPGTVAYDSETGKIKIREADLNWKIAEACAKELETYAGVTAYLLREEFENPSIQERVNRAIAVGADIYISLHNNSSLAGTGTGAEIFYPNASSYNKDVNVVGHALAEEIQMRLVALGLTNRGTKTLNYDGVYYPDGSAADYYAVIRDSRLAGLLGILIEHAFVDNENDAVFLLDDENLTRLGIADAEGIASYYGLIKVEDAQSVASISVRANVVGLGWQTTVYDKKTAGTIAKNLGIQALELSLQNAVAQTGGIEYRCFFGDSWQGWVSDGQTSGTLGEGGPIQAIQIRLTGSAAQDYDIYYRVYNANFGWLDWAKNGDRAGSVGYSYPMEALQVVVLPKDAATPGNTDAPYKQQGDNPGTGFGYILTYQAHVADIGWQSEAEEAEMVGTTGLALAMEALLINLSYQPYTGDITYNVHVANIGWQGWKTSGQMAGTTGQALRMEAIRINLTGRLAEMYDVYYRAHVTSLGWLDWVKNGETAGTTGRSLRLEAIEIKLVEKTPDDSKAVPLALTIEAQAHVAQIGWLSHVSGDKIIGTTGIALAMEAIIFDLPSQQPYTGTGDITYNVHVANIGWQGWKTSGQMAGTTGQALRMEAIQINLTGQLAEMYDIRYRAHVANLGWLDWVENGETAGTTGRSLRLEALEVVLVAKEDPIVDGTPIMGLSQTTVAQMVRYYNQSEKTYPSSVYAQYGAPTITDFCTILLQEANAEGVRAEVVFAQAMHETGWLQFGGDVLAEQCNFAGIGATGGGVPGNSFNTNDTDSVRIGLRAQVQHLKAYASTASPNQVLVDPRFDYVTRGCAPTVEALGGKWATDIGYGARLVAQISALLSA